MNQIETWFGVITNQAIRRGTFTSVNALINRIRAYVEHWNTDAEPFVWTATAEDPNQGPLGRNRSSNSSTTTRSNSTSITTH